MANTKTKDEIIVELQEQIKIRKEEIKSIERPNWKTPCAFKETPNGYSINIHTIQDPSAVINILAFLKVKKESIEAASKELGFEGGVFKHDGYTYNDWKHDLQLRLSKITIAGKKAKLDDLEKRLAKLESPELREQRELEAIMKELEN
jgi:hypothetical protein